MAENSSRDLLEFPCQYQFKAIGAAGEQFRQDVCTAANCYAKVPSDAVRWQDSRHGNYQSVSMLITLHSYEQMTNIYAELKTINGLKMLL